MTTVSIPGSSARTLVGSLALRRYSPEFRLVLLCLRRPLDAEGSLAIADAGEAVHDWNHVLRIASRHRVVGLLARGLQRAGFRLPPLHAAELRRMASIATLQAMALSVESLRLQRLLEASGVDALFLKGTAVAMLAYGDVSVRHAKDIDLLVPEAAAEQAMRALRLGGYLPAFDLDAVPADRRGLWFRYAKSMDWVHPDNSLHLELHWRLTDLRTFEGTPHITQRVTVAGGRTLDTLAEDQLLAYLCVHGAAHGWMRLKWLADVYALLPHRDSSGCEAVYLQLVEQGAGRSAGQALLLCHHLLQLPLSPPLLKRLQSDRVLRFLQWSALRLLARGGEDTEVDDLPFGTTSVYLSRLLLGRGPGSFVDELRTWGYRPDELLRTRLPNGLMFLFPLVRVGSWMLGRLRHGGRSPHTR